MPHCNACHFTAESLSSNERGPPVRIFSFVGFTAALLCGCTYFTEVSRYDPCDGCDAAGSTERVDLDKADAAADGDAADTTDREISNCANGRDC
jgi:hypothetical protein